MELIDNLKIEDLGCIITIIIIIIVLFVVYSPTHWKSNSEETHQIDDSSLQ